ncbi:hypothetical protein Tco_1177696, partial [Tanacetum coccineum]
MVEDIPIDTKAKYTSTDGDPLPEPSLYHSIMGSLRVDYWEHMVYSRINQLSSTGFNNIPELPWVEVRYSNTHLFNSARDISNNSMFFPLY